MSRFKPGSAPARGGGESSNQGSPRRHSPTPVRQFSSIVQDAEAPPEY